MEKKTRVAHRWTTQTVTSAHPMDYRNSLPPRQSMWGAKWNKDTEARDILLRQLQSLGQQTLLTTPREWTAKSARHTLSSMKRNQARGFDGWTLGEILRLPRGATASLANVMKKGESVSRASHLRQRRGLAREANLG